MLLKKLTSFFVATNKKEQIKNIERNGYEFEHDKEIILGSLSLAYKAKPSEILEWSVEDVFNAIPTLPGESKFAHLVYVRTEKNKDHIKNFTDGEMKERRKWQDFIERLKIETLGHEEIKKEDDIRRNDIMDRFMARFQKGK